MSDVVAERQPGPFPSAHNRLQREDIAQQRINVNKKKVETKWQVVDGKYPGRRRCATITADSMLEVLQSQVNFARGWCALCCICRNGIPQKVLRGQTDQLAWSPCSIGS